MKELSLNKLDKLLSKLSEFEKRHWLIYIACFPIWVLLVPYLITRVIIWEFQTWKYDKEDN